MKIIDINGAERNAKKVFPDPDYPGFMRIEFKRYHEWYSIDEFNKFNPKLKHLTKGAPKIPEDIVGTVSSAGKDFIKDTSQNWSPDSFLGFFAWISRGKGEGQKRTIVKNTKNTITVDKPWKPKPSKNSQYVLSHNVQEVRAMGNSMGVQNMADIEKKALEMDKKWGRLDTETLNKNYKYIDKSKI